MAELPLDLPPLDIVARADEKLPYPSEVEDLALNYAETEVGRFDFCNNWKSRRMDANLPEAIRFWLTISGADPELAPSIIHFLDALCAKTKKIKTPWIN